jgi:aspartyl/asparaginyl-tRNA synthetase
LSKERLAALIQLRSIVLRSLRRWLQENGFEEVTASSIVNFAGSCENPYASFPIDVYGQTAYLAQSAQLQLEPVVLRLKERVFTQATSFRAEDYDDPESPGRRLSEFTLIEAEAPFPTGNPDTALDDLLNIIESMVKRTIAYALDHSQEAIGLLGGNIDFLRKVTETQFSRITWSAARRLIDQEDSPRLDFGMVEERKILSQHGNFPVFITTHPSEIKFFNLKRSEDDKHCFSVDLLLPPLGETVGGGLREENAKKIKQSLIGSRVGKILAGRNEDSMEVFRQYIEVLKEEEELLRGGFGLGFERFVAFLIGTNDILETVLDKDAVLPPRNTTH